VNPTTRIWAIASGAAVVAALCGGWFLGVQPQLANAATAITNEASVTTQNQATMIKIAGLSKAAAKQDAMQAEAQVLDDAIPEILKPNRFIRRVNEVAALNAVSVQSVTPGDAVAYAPPASATGTAAAPAGTLPAPKLARTSPLITAQNLAVVPTTVVVTGSRYAVMQFAHDLQNDQRVFTITGLQLSKDDNSSGVSLSLSGDIYTLQR
jgi:Tfp pilus assembly protein PilO